MYKRWLLLLAILFPWLLMAQVKEDFLSEIKNNLHSYNALRPILARYNTDNTNWVQPYTNFFGCKSYFNIFFFHNLEAATDSSGNQVSKVDNSILTIPVTIYYYGDKIVYITVVLENKLGYSYITHDDTLFRYMDKTFSNKMLDQYNRRHKTAFTWRDLYEDNINSFYLVTGTGGSMEETEWATIYLPMVQHNDHPALLQECRSFNPIRRTYGALGLYLLQQKGKTLTIPELKLLESISSSAIVIPNSYGCLGTNEPIAEVFKKAIKINIILKDIDNNQ